MRRRGPLHEEKNNGNGHASVEIPGSFKNNLGKERKIRVTPLQLSLLVVFLFTVLVVVVFSAGAWLGPSNEVFFSHKFDQAFRDAFPFDLPAQLVPGQFHPFVWKDNSKLVDKNGGIVGLPPELTKEIYKFCEETGLMDIFQELLYEEKMKYGVSKLLDMGEHSPRTWAATTPKKTANWAKSDIHWVDATDEVSFEETLRVLERGNFDVVLDAIGKAFGSEGLMVAGMGFIITSYTYEGDSHQDLPGSGGFWWDLLFPLILPSKTPAHLVIGDDADEERFADFPMTPNVGTLIGGDTYHATGKCDFRPTQEFRVAVSIYIVDVNKDNVDLVADDGTALFPIPHETEWLLAQEGRLWSKQGGRSLKNDKGRKPYSAEDSNDDCPGSAEDGYCELELWDTRMSCLKSCEIFIDDEVYFSKLFPSSIL